MYLKRWFGVRLLAGKDTDRIMRATRTSPLREIAYKLGSQFLIDRDFPLHLYLELSRACNFNCPMCMRKEAGPGGHFPKELARKIISEAAKKGPTSYSLHLFGEPLANPEWGDIVGMIRSANRYNAILLTTNGSFMDEACCRKLLELEVNRIFVSVHSLDPDTYRKNTGGGDISVALNNIRTFMKMAAGAGKNRLFVRLFHKPGEPPAEEKNLKALRDTGVSWELRGYHNFAGGKNEWTTHKQDINRWPCFHPWFTLGIAVDGKITVCCTDARLKLVVGNAFNESIERAWKSEAVKTIRQEHLKKQFKAWKECSICDTWQFHPDIFFGYQSQKDNGKKERA